jgi:tetratricopeptide (TPR) repeat protein
MSHQRSWRLWPALLVLLVIGLCGSSTVMGQPLGGRRIVVDASGNPVNSSLTASLPEDRDTVRKLNTAKTQLAAKNYGEAVRILGSILESPEDYFFKPDPNGKSYVSIRREVERLLGTLPEEGRRALVQRYGSPARKLLEEAIKTGDVKKLQDVSGRFFHTEPGYQATLLLGEQQLDVGQPFAAALTLERLLKTPAKARNALEPALSIKVATSWFLAQRPDRARQVLEELKKSFPNAMLQISGREIGLFGQGTDPLAWLQPLIPAPTVERTTSDRDHWLVRHDAARSGLGSSHNPQLQFVWLAPQYSNSDIREFDSSFAVGGIDIDKGVSEVLKSTAATYRQQNLIPMPALQPLVVGDKVFMRTATGVWALDMKKEGSRMWPMARDDAMIGLILAAAKETPATTSGGPGGGGAPGAPGGFPGGAPGGPPGGAPGGPPGGAPGIPMRRGIYPQVETQQDQYKRNLAVTQRVFLDATYGSMSSDGELLFVIEDVPLFKSFNYPYWGGMPLPGPGQGSQQQSHSHLRAYSISTAKLMWELGGHKGASVSPLAGAFFLGPPLPLGGRLYAIAEMNGQISLHAIDQQNGKARFNTPKIAWSQPLCNVENRIDNDLIRQTAGISPAYADGIIVCPTAAGAVVAVDLTSRSLMWAYTFSRDENTVNYAGGGGFGVLPDGRIIMPQGGNLPAGWADTGVILAEGKVLATERGSRNLHCLNVEDGGLAWQMARGDSLYVGGVFEGNVVVVGPNYVRAQKLADGSPAWQTTTFEKGAKTCGRGFHHSGVYVVPLDDGRVASVEMKTGELKYSDERVLPEKQGSLGNLVCVSGWVISQDLTGLHGFRQISLDALLQSLKATPNDINLLTQLGELLRQKGRHEEALGHLRKAAELSKAADPAKAVPAQRLLARAMLHALQQDFAEHRGLADELEKLTIRTEFTDMRGDFLRTMSEGLFALKQHAAAVDALLKLTDLDLRGGKLQQASGSLQLRHDRWVQVQLERYQQDAPAALREQIAGAIAARIKAAGPSASPEALRRLLQYFGGHAAADDVRWRLAEMLLAQKQSRLETEMLLRRLERSPDAQRSREAVAHLAEFYRASDDWPRQSHGFPAAQVYFDRLKGELAGTVCLNGKTGKELFEQALAADENFRGFLEAKPLPDGLVKVQSAETAASEPPRPSAPLVDVSLRTADDPLVGHLKFQFRGGTLFVRSSSGRPLWQLSLAQSGQVAPSSVAFGHPLAAHGHLLVFSTGYELFGIDASPGTADEKRLLWRQMLSKTSLEDRSSDLVPTPLFEPTAWGRSMVRFRNPQGQPLGSLQVVVGARQVAFVRGTELIALDPLSGEIVWKRGGIDLGSDLLGDDEHLFVVAAEATTAKMFRAADGVELGTRNVPHRTQRMATYGSRVLAWLSPLELRLVDLAADKTVWMHRVGPAAKAALAGPDEVAVMDNRSEELVRAGRHFQVFSVADGKLRFAAPLEECKEDVGAIYVLRSRDCYVLAVSAPGTGVQVLPGGFRILPAGTNNQQFEQPQINGHVYGFQRPGGRRMWHLEAANLGLPLLQPSDSPVLTFLTTVYGRGVVAGGGRTATVFQTAAAFVDKRKGRVLHKEVIPHPPNVGLTTLYDLSTLGDKVRFTHPGREITLTFTGEPIPPDAKKLDLSLELAAGAPQPGGPPAVRLRDGDFPGEFEAVPKALPKLRKSLPKEPTPKSETPR